MHTCSDRLPQLFIIVTIMYIIVLADNLIVLYSNISLGFCARRQPVKVTANQYWFLPPHSSLTYVNQSVQQHSRHFCQQIGYTYNGGSLTDPQKCVTSISVSLVYSPYIQLEFLDNFLYTDDYNLLPVLTYVAFRNAHPDKATMEDVKKALSYNDIEFSQLQYWNADRCVVWVE